MTSVMQLYADYFVYANELTANWVNSRASGLLTEIQIGESPSGVIKMWNSRLTLQVKICLPSKYYFKIHV